MVYSKEMAARVSNIPEPWLALPVWKSSDKEHSLHLNETDVSSMRMLDRFLRYIYTNT